MSPTPLRDPNAPPDPSELREIPDHQMAPDAWVGAAHNPVAPGAPPSPDFPTGVPPTPATNPPVNIDVPHAEGPDGNPVAFIGDTVTVSLGNWQNSPDTFEFQWNRDKSGTITAVPGAIDQSYVTVTQDSGLAVFCTVMASNAVGQTSADSNEVAVKAPVSKPTASEKSAKEQEPAKKK